MKTVKTVYSLFDDVLTSLAQLQTPDETYESGELESDLRYLSESLTKVLDNVSDYDHTETFGALYKSMKDLRDAASKTVYSMQVKEPYDAQYMAVKSGIVEVKQELSKLLDIIGKSDNESVKAQKKTLEYLQTFFDQQYAKFPDGVKSPAPTAPTTTAPATATPTLASNMMEYVQKTHAELEKAIQSTVFTENTEYTTDATGKVTITKQDPLQPVQARLMDIYTQLDAVVRGRSTLQEEYFKLQKSIPALFSTMQAAYSKTSSDGQEVLRSWMGYWQHSLGELMKLIKQQPKNPSPIDIDIDYSF